MLQLDFSAGEFSGWIILSQTSPLRTFAFSLRCFHWILTADTPRVKMLVLEEQRYIHEDLERLEQGIADRMLDEPKQVSFLPAQRRINKPANSSL